LDERRDGPHGQDQPHRIRQLKESMRRVELYRPFVDRVNQAVTLSRAERKALSSRSFALGG
jgi:hypothetical protein